VMTRDESSKALTDGIQKNGSLIYDLHLFSANQKSSHKVLTDSLKIIFLTNSLKYSKIQKKIIHTGVFRWSLSLRDFCVPRGRLLFF
ncbi:MAG: hypothetical protein C6W57_13750, partial [Caldibacillus debilis]